MEVLITEEALAARLAAGQRTVILDVRWALGSSTGEEDHLAGHIPGAVYVDLDTELAAPARPEAGRHPLPEPQRLAAATKRWGIEPADTVVVYDAVGGLSAARAWWLLRDAGLSEVFLLDGGWAAWTAAGGEVATGQVTATPGSWVPHPGSLPVVDAAGAAAFPFTGVLLDARAGERFRGETEPVDPRPGHIPGALNAPTAGNLAADGKFLPAETLREKFAALGPAAGGPPVAVYCGSGVTAAHEIAALAIAGIDAALYPGSYSQFSSDPAREVATGPTG